MVVERTNKEIVTRLSLNIDTEELQSFLNCARYKELTANHNITQEDVDELARDVNASWGKQNKAQFGK